VHVLSDSGKTFDSIVGDDDAVTDGDSTEL